MAHLALSFLGGFAASRDGVAVSAFGVDKARGLLAYLAVETGAHRRARLNGLFWPELPEKKASHNLSQTLLRLRRALGDSDVSSEFAFLKLTAHDAQLNPTADCAVDVMWFRDLMRLSKRHSHGDPATCPVCYQWLREAAELYCGDFLAGLFLPGCVEFEEWRLVQQESLRSDALEALERLAAYHETRGEFEACQEYARRQLTLEPWRESAHLRLMRSLATAGQTQAALKQFEAYRQTLAGELSLAPAAEVTALYEQILSGKIAQPETSAREGFWLSGAGERRQVTALVCSRGAREGSEDEDAALGCSALCERIHYRFGGWRAQRQGSACVVYFGYPQAYEDAARRAAHAGMALAEAQGGEGAARVGIHTGIVLIGEGRGPRWQERDLVGDTPEIARATQRLAEPGEVVITDATRQLVQEAFDLEPLAQTASLTGRFPALYRIRGESVASTRLEWLARAQRLTTFVGRDAELAQLWEWFEQAQGGAGRVALLTGEPGIGKSRLIWELRQRAMAGADSPPRSLWWVSRCLPHYQNTSLYPMVGVLEQMFGFAPGESAASRQSKVDGLLAWYDLERPAAGWMRSVLLGLPPDPATSATAPPTISAAQREQMRELFVTLVRKRAAEQPVTLVIEDLQWADPSTVEWLGLSVEALAGMPCLTLLTARSKFAPPWLSHEERPSLVQRTLRPLTDEVVDLIVRDMAGALELDDSLRRRIVAETDGVPIFAEELTKAVLEQIGSGHDVRTTIPSTLVDSLAARLEHLGAARETAQWAATVGREFTHPVLRSITGMDEDRLEADLARLIEAGLVTPIPAAPQDVAYFVTVPGAAPPRRYSFKHSLVQEAAYASLPKRARQERHRRVAETIEAQFPRMAETRPELVAGHYANGSRRAKAVDFYVSAGERARSQGATLEAKNFFNRAYELLEPNDDERRWRVLVAREQVLDTRGERSEQQAVLDELLALAQVLDDDTRRARVYLWQTAFAGVTGDLNATLPLAETAARFARRAGSLDMELNALIFRAQTLLFLGQAEDAGQIIEEVLARSPKLTDESVRALALSLGAHYCCDTGDLVRAVALQVQSVDLARSASKKAQQLSNRANLALLYSMLGLYPQARVLLQETLADAELWGERRLYGATLAQLASVYWWTDDLPRAKETFELSLAEYQAAADAYGAAGCVVSLAQLAEKEGNLTLAVELLSAAKSQYASIGAAPDSLEAQAFEARVMLALGQGERVLAAALEVWQYAQEHGVDSLVSGAAVYLALADVLEGIGCNAPAPRAIIEAGYRDVIARADKISNAEWRRSFLENVPENRALLARWREFNQQ